MNHPIKSIIKQHKQGSPVGISSICSSNALVIEAAMEIFKTKDAFLLIEATANQVNQFGGYTQMVPKDFVNFIHSIAAKVNFPKEKLILGGDHLGPLIWTNLNQDTAMSYSEELIRQYVLAGFTKIHLDTSMPIYDDLTQGTFNDTIIAKRASVLCKAAETAYLELKSEQPDALHPVYIIGSEVPIPGGAREEHANESLSVTKISDLQVTLDAFKEAFNNHDLSQVFDDYVIGVVVQPGVEFSTDTIWPYNRKKAQELADFIKKNDHMVFEAHSTDYQTAAHLKELVEDGFAILKVGPALTFGLREALFAMNHIEEELFTQDENVELSNFIQVLDLTMKNNPTYWSSHYKGCAKNMKFERKYSLSDRCRYYLPDENVEKALQAMLNHFGDLEIPFPLISQYLPLQSIRVKEGSLPNHALSLIKDRINDYIRDYIAATLS